MSNSVIILKSAIDYVVAYQEFELTLYPVDVTPSTVILNLSELEIIVTPVVITLAPMGITDTWPVVNQVTGGIEWYQDGVKFVGTLSSGSSVFPIEPDVRIGIIYGPSGIDYTGTYNPPVGGGGVSRGRVTNA